MTEYELSRVAENGVFIRDREGKEVFLEGERVVIAIGTRPDNGLYDEINSLGITIYQIGDCLEPRGAKAAISEGAEIGRAI
jgi:2,4-dienoyl-CoA reductase (NADPH2)